MNDRAGNRLKDARRINFRNKPVGLRDFLGGDDSTDIYRFNARSSTIEITARQLRDRDSVDLYQVDGRLRQVLNKIGKKDLTNSSNRRINRFLKAVDVSEERRGRRDQYRATVEKGKYFLVVSSNDNTQKKYRLRFSADDRLPDTVGNTRGTAKFTTLGTVESERIGNTDTSDVFRFVLGDRRQVSFALRGLTQNATLALLDNTKTLKVSATAGTAPEFITRNLEAGTYYVQVSSLSPIETSYSLATFSSALTQTVLYSGVGLPSAGGQLELTQVPFTPDEIDTIVDSVNVNGAPLSSTTARNTLRTYLLDNFSADAADEVAGANGVTLDTEVVPASTQGQVGYSNKVPDYDNFNINLSLAEAFALLTGNVPSSIDYTASIDDVNASFPVLNASLGYTLSFTVSIDAETSSQNRAGFSILAVNSDGTSSIELGFTNSDIFAQSTTFTRAETFTPTTFNMSDRVRYDLYVADTGYQLFANSSPVLSGSLRTYDFDPMTSDPPLPLNPYRTPNLLFLGDNSDFSSATFTLGNVSLFT
ncbi:MAG: pre-peptidase C-terminal domain-containing protein [Leptolyngbyaceae bacterium]|nr:pre-peptidase C-terminal domain-containing protein [Leptolyngbyaceae bacterium]